MTNNYNKIINNILNKVPKQSRDEARKNIGYIISGLKNESSYSKG